MGAQASTNEEPPLPASSASGEAPPSDTPATGTSSIFTDAFGAVGSAVGSLGGAVGLLADPGSTPGTTALAGPAKSSAPNLVHAKTWGEDTRLCGGSLVVAPEGLSLLLWGARSGKASKEVAVFTSRYAKSDHEAVFVRCVSTDEHASSPGILMETKESHPLAYLSTDYMALWCGANLNERTCAIFRNDLSLFALATSEEGSNILTVRQRNDTIATFIVDFTGTHANVQSSAGHLLGTVIPDDGDLGHPIRRDQAKPEKDGEPRPHKPSSTNQIVTIAPGVDAGLVLTTIIAALHLDVGHL